MIISATPATLPTTLPTTVPVGVGASSPSPSEAPLSPLSPPEPPPRPPPPRGLPASVLVGEALADVESVEWIVEADEVTVDESTLLNDELAADIDEDSSLRPT